jgi:uncharacterized protein (TIGR02145 family)
MVTLKGRAVPPFTRQWPCMLPKVLFRSQALSYLKSCPGMISGWMPATPRPCTCRSARALSFQCSCPSIVSRRCYQFVCGGIILFCLFLWYYIGCKSIVLYFSLEPNFAYMSISAFRTLAFVAFAVITAPLFSQSTCELDGLFGPPPFGECGDTQEHDGYDYATVQIGDQCWFSENLRSDHYRNGDAIPGDLDDATWSSTVAGAQAYYNYDPANLAVYGRLYNWYAVDDARGLCPSGWHVPTDAEYTTLTDFLGGASVAGSKMKEAGTAHWTSTNTDANNSSGFTALGSGICFANAGFTNLLYNAFFWSSSPSGGSAWGRSLDASFIFLGRLSSGGRFGFAVRCARD